MQNVEISVSFASLMGAVGTVVGGYIIWSAKKLIGNLENMVTDMKEEMQERCKEHEERLVDHERCLIKIVTNHERNHGQHIGCER